ncbi:MAG: hypothetical protein GWN58_36005, partial [Anaerolineae bacterium]|nr:hypothetical protein [Anaerolineae bacterium]
MDLISVWPRAIIGTVLVRKPLARQSVEAWQRNLYVIWISQLVAIIGFAVVFPFLPYYVQELGVTELHEVELWSGVLFATQAVTMAI